NLRTRAALQALAPQYPWHEYFTAAGIDAQPEVIVMEPDVFAKSGALFRATPVAHWRSYVKYHFLAGKADVLPKAIDDEAFDFEGRVLSGQPQQSERWKRAVEQLDRALGEAVGQLYVARYFSPESKGRARALAENLRAAYVERIKQLPWMTAQTKH